jgi:hypothetical protein
MSSDDESEFIWFKIDYITRRNEEEEIKKQSNKIIFLYNFI